MTLVVSVEETKSAQDTSFLSWHCLKQCDYDVINLTIIIKQHKKTYLNSSKGISRENAITGRIWYLPRKKKDNQLLDMCKHCY